jgi:hypothetical protein
MDLARGATTHTANLSDDAFACAPLSSLPPSAIVQSVASPHVSRASTMPALTLIGDFRV